MNKVLFLLSNISNLIPVIPFIFTFKKNEKPFNTILYILILGFLNDLLSFLRYNYFREFQLFLKINDLYRIACLGLWLYFFNQLNKDKKANRDFLIFSIGLILLLLDWAFFSKTRRNSFFPDIYTNIIYINLCLKRINYQILNKVNINKIFDPVLVFCLSMCTFYCFHLFLISIYFLEIPLIIKIKPALWNIIPILNIIVNIIYAITFLFLPKRNELSA